MKLEKIQIDYHYTFKLKGKEYCAIFAKPTKGKPRLDLISLPECTEVIDSELRKKVREELGLIHLPHNKRGKE